MGENPKYVFNYGALGVENIKNLNFLIKQIEKKTKLNLIKEIL